VKTNQREAEKAQIKIPGRDERETSQKMNLATQKKLKYKRRI
jgi:hypothetical protein